MDHHQKVWEPLIMTFILTLGHPATSGLNFSLCPFWPWQPAWDLYKPKSDHATYLLRSLQSLLQLSWKCLSDPLAIHSPLSFSVIATRLLSVPETHQALGCAWLFSVWNFLLPEAPHSLTSLTFTPITSFSLKPPFPSHLKLQTLAASWPTSSTYSTPLFPWHLSPSYAIYFFRTFSFWLSWLRCELLEDWNLCSVCARISLTLNTMHAT